MRCLMGVVLVGLFVFAIDVQAKITVEDLTDYYGIKINAEFTRKLESLLERYNKTAKNKALAASLKQTR